MAVPRFLNIVELPLWSEVDDLAGIVFNPNMSAMDPSEPFMLILAGFFRFGAIDKMYFDPGAILSYPGME